MCSIIFFICRAGLIEKAKRFALCSILSAAFCAEGSMVCPAVGVDLIPCGGDMSSECKFVSLESKTCGEFYKLGENQTMHSNRFPLLLGLESECEIYDVYRADVSPYSGAYCPDDLYPRGSCALLLPGTFGSKNINRGACIGYSDSDVEPDGTEIVKLVDLIREHQMLLPNYRVTLPDSYSVCGGGEKEVHLHIKPDPNNEYLGNRRLSGRICVSKHGRPNARSIRAIDLAHCATGEPKVRKIWTEYGTIFSAMGNAVSSVYSFVSRFYNDVWSGKKSKVLDANFSYAVLPGTNSSCPMGYKRFSGYVKSDIPGNCFFNPDPVSQICLGYAPVHGSKRISDTKKCFRIGRTPYEFMTDTGVSLLNTLSPLFKNAGSAIGAGVNAMSNACVRALGGSAYSEVADKGAGYRFASLAGPGHSCGEGEIFADISVEPDVENRCFRNKRVKRGICFSNFEKPRAREITDVKDCIFGEQLNCLGALEDRIKKSSLWNGVMKSLHDRWLRFSRGSGSNILIDQGYSGYKHASLSDAYAACKNGEVFANVGVYRDNEKKCFGNKKMKYGICLGNVMRQDTKPITAIGGCIFDNTPYATRLYKAASNLIKDSYTRCFGVLKSYVLDRVAEIQDSWVDFEDDLDSFFGW